MRTDRIPRGFYAAGWLISAGVMAVTFRMWQLHVREVEQRDIEVVAEAADGQHAVALAAEHRPDIALMDIQMPVLDGLEATRQIVADERLDSVRVVILSNFGLDEYIFRALRAGASGFLLKDTQPAELLQALRVLMRGDSLLSPAITRRLISEFVARPPDAVTAVGMESLTNRV